MAMPVESIRILHMTTRYVDLNSGVKQVLRELLRAQNRLDELDVWVYETKHHRLISPLEEVRPAEIQDLLRLKPQLVVFHSIYILAYRKLARALTRAGIPYLVEPHGSLSKRAQEKSLWKKKIVNFLWIDAWIRRGKTVIYLCEEERAASRLPDLPNVIIPNTFPTLFEISEEILPVHNPVKLMMLGRIVPFHKGMDRFFNALQALPASFETKILVEIYGYGSEKNMAWLQDQIQNTSKVEIQFKGSVFGEEKTKAFKNADLFCMFSRSEGLPLTLYEAVASGLPLIVTEGSNRAAWVEKSENGWILWDEDEKDWGEKLVSAIAAYGQAPQTYKQNALQSAKDLPTWDEIAKGTVELYKKWGKFSPLQAGGFQSASKHETNGG